MAPTKPDPDTVATVRRMLARASTAEVSRALGLCHATVARIAGELPITAGTAALLKLRLPDAVRSMEAPR